ncbi:hypothetical protein SB816_30895, partial [Achromobacter sp. SIMBA_011]|uniref:hypothetical protein n=1 Tax=Achromobacter sp. SIMBA_011 TaxID=3085759 RepID=UPI00397B7A8D
GGSSAPVIPGDIMMQTDLDYDSIAKAGSMLGSGAVIVIHGDTDAQDVSLADYVSRMKPEQSKIYYVTADTWQAAKNSPHLEVFRKKGVEVLLLTDR